MTLSENTVLRVPVELIKTAGTSSDVAIIIGSGAPDGNTDPQASAAKGSIYIQDDAADDECALYQKVDNAVSDDDWQPFLIAGEVVSAGRLFATDVTMNTDRRIYFRDSAIYIHSNAEGEVTITADGQVNIGDGTNQVEIQADGEINLAGTAMVTEKVQLPIAVGGGTADVTVFNGAPSINLDTDGETFLASFEAPKAWSAAADLTLVLMVANEIAEDDGDDVSISGQVRGYADGETTGDAGQAVACALNLTGGDEAINVVNRVTGAIDYNEGTYPIAAGDTVVVECTVNLGGAGEATGPLHVISWWVEYTANKLGTAT